MPSVIILYFNHLNTLYMLLEDHKTKKGSSYECLHQHIFRLNKLLAYLWWLPWGSRRYRIPYHSRNRAKPIVWTLPLISSRLMTEIYESFYNILSSFFFGIKLASQSIAVWLFSLLALRARTLSCTIDSHDLIEKMPNLKGTILF